MNTELYEKYINIRTQIEELEQQKHDIEIAVLDDIDTEHGGKPVSTPFGTFWPMGRTTWEYSPAVTALQEKVKAEKKKEEQSGIASIKSSTRFIRLTKNG